MAKAVNFDSELKSKKYTPSSKKTWSVKLASEFIGTIFLSWMIGLLGVTFGGTKFEELLSGGHGVSRLAIGFWLWLDIFLCLAIFARWSCDLNPLVSTFRMLTKEDSVKYGLIKIFIQLLGGLIAGMVIIGTQQMAHAITDNSGDALNSANSSWASFVNVAPKQGAKMFGYITYGGLGHHAIAILGEAMGAFILVWAVFNKSIKNAAIKDMVIALAIGIGVAAMLDFGTVAWNPARLLATQYIFDIFKGGHHAMIMFPTYVAGEFLGIFIFFGVQKFMDKYGIELWEKWMSLGQIKEVSLVVNKPAAKKAPAKKTSSTKTAAAKKASTKTTTTKKTKK